MNGLTAAVTIEYRFADGLHILTSPDLYGLFLAGPNPVDVLDDLIPSCRELLRLNHGVEATVEPLLRLDDLTRTARPDLELRTMTLLVRPIATALDREVATPIGDDQDD